MQLKTVMVIVAAVLSVALGVLTQWLEPGPYLTGGVLVILLGYGVRLFHPVVRRSPRYDPVPPRRRGTISRWIFVGGLPYVAWVVVVATGVDWKGWTGLLVGLPLISWLVWISATGVEVLRLTRRDERKATLRERLKTWRSRNLPAVPTTTQVLADESMMIKRARQVMKEVLEMTGDYGYLVVEEPYKTSDHCLVVPVRIPSKVAAQLAQQEADERNGVKTTSKGVAAFGPGSATTVAIAFGEKTRTPMPKGWITVEPTEYEGVFKIIVLSRDVMADVIVWENDETPTTSDEPALVSYFKDGAENRMDLRGNGLIVAMSQAGKTNILMVLILFYLRCTDTIVWVGGVRKQFETFWPLIAKYLGSRFRMPIDLLVTGQSDTAMMVLTALNLIDYRNGLKDKTGLKRVKLIIDEWTDVAENKKVMFYYASKNIWMDVATGVRMINRVGKSVYVEADLATHRDTNSNLGSDGGDLKSGMDWTIGLRTNEIASLHRLFNNYSLEPLVNQGELYAARTGTQPRRSKAPYVQEVGKPTAPQTGGTTVTEAGWSRRHLVEERQLTATEQQACGEFYLNRHTHVTPELEEYLRFGPIETTENIPAEPEQQALNAGPVGIPIDGPNPAEAGRRYAEELIARQEAEWAAAEAAQAPQPTTPPDAPNAPVVVSSLDNARQRKGRPAAILRLLAEGPMTVATLIERMRADGDTAATRPLIYNALSKLRDEGAIKSEDVNGEVIHRLVGAA